MTLAQVSALMEVQVKVNERQKAMVEAEQRKAAASADH